MDLPVGDEKDLAERIAGLGPLPQFTTQMNEPTKRMSQYFKNKPHEDNLHIIVEKPVIGTCFLGHPGLRTDGVVSWHAPILLLPHFSAVLQCRSSVFELQAPTEIMEISVHLVRSNISGFRRACQHLLASPPKIKRQQLQNNLIAAIAPFQEYISLLALGELDGYMHSLRSEDKPAVPGMVVSNRIHLLVHDLGNPDRIDEERVKKLFDKRTMFVAFSITNIESTDPGRSPATCSTLLAPEKRVLSLMAFARTGVFISRVEAKESGHMGPWTSR